jgi:L-malate glycosyltransferase
VKIAITGPIHQSAVANLLRNYNKSDLPAGYNGAPFLGNLITSFLNMGHEVVAITTSTCINGDWSTQDFSQDNFKWIVIPSRPHALKFKYGKVGKMVDFFAFEQHRMIEALRKEQPDIVHGHWSYEFAGAAIRSGFPHLITVHDNHWLVLRYMPNLYRFSRALLAEWNLRKLATVSTVSPYMADFLKKKVVHVRVIPNPVSIKLSEIEVNQLVERRSKTLNSPHLVMVNNGWDGLKNGIFGLKVFNCLQKLMPDAQLHLVGNGTEPGGLADSDAQRLGIKSGIIFHGVINQDSLFQLLKKVHVLLHTSKEESFGVVLIEAASYGIPSFGYFEAGAVPWVINQDELLYKDWEASGVARQIHGLLTNALNYKQTSKLVNDYTVDSFAVEKVANSYIHAYNELLK